MARPQRDWRKLLNEYRKCGTTQRTFCDARKISLNTFQYHLQKERSSSAELAVATPSFIELSPPAERKSVEIEILLPSGVALRLRG